MDQLAWRSSRSWPCAASPACALPRPSAIASAKLANSTVNQSQRVICSAKPRPRRAGDQVADEQDRGQRGDDLDGEHHRVADQRARIELARRRRPAAGPRIFGSARVATAPLRLRERAVMVMSSAQKSVPAFIAKCSTIGPSASAGKKCRPPTIRITPTSRPTNSGAVGREGAGRGRHDLLGGERAGDRQHRHDHQEAADAASRARASCCRTACWR